MSIPEVCIKAAEKNDFACSPELRARRVILALASDLPESAVEKAAFSICQSGKFETGEGRCAMICMDSLGNKPKQCAHASRVHGKLACAAIIAALKDIVEGE